MQPIYENIAVAIDSSLKIATYRHGETCKLSNWHIHPEYELVYVRNGSGILRIGNRTEHYTDGTLIFLGPNIPHLDFSNKKYPDNLEVVIQFGKEFIEEKLAVFPEFRNIKNLMHQSKSVLLFENDIKETLSIEFEKFDTLNATQQLIQFMAILEKLARCDAYRNILDASSLQSFKTTDVNRLEDVFEFVNENYNEQLTAKNMASHLGLTTNSFCRFFKKMTNKTFIQFVNEFRIRKATELFNETSLSVSEVMYQCGFNDASYFTKQFKKHQGVTPSNHLSMVV